MADNEATILAGVAEVVSEETGLDTDEITMDKSFTEDLDIDSLTMTSVVVQAEEKFGIKIPDEDMGDLRTVADVVTYIQKAQG